jgi:PAS domain S-box-containing protein
MKTFFFNIALHSRKATSFLFALRAIAVGLMLCSLPVYGLEKVTLQLKWHHQFQFAGYYAAKEMGYYKEAGLDVSIEPVSKNKDPISNVVEGGAQYGVGGSDLLLVRQSGKPVVVLGVIFQHSPYVLIAKQKSGIKNLSDLIGKRVMIDPNAAEIVAFLKKSNIPLNRLTLSTSIDYGADALISGQADAIATYITNDPWYLSEAGVPYEVFRPKSVGIDFYGDNLFTTEAELKDHPDRAKAFLEASLRGWNYALEHPDVVIDLMVSKGYVSSAAQDKLFFEAIESVQLIHSDIVELGYMRDDRWQQIVDTYADLGMLPKNFSLEGFLFNQHPAQTPKWIGFLIGVLLLSIIIILAYIYKTNLARHSDQTKIRISEIKHRKAMEIAGLGSYALDVVTGHWESCEQLDAILGIDESYVHDIPGWSNIIAPEFRQRVLDYYLEVIRERKDFRMDYQIVRLNDGQVRWVAANGELEYDRAGKPIQLIGTIKDITQRKLEEDKLIGANERLTLATKAGGVGIWDWDIVQKILSWDDQMFLLHGVDRADFSGTYEAFKAGILLKELPRIELEVQSALRGEKEFDTEFRVVIPDGSIRNIRAISITKFDDSGKPVRMIGTNWDVTDIRQTERVLAQYRDHLEEVVTERTKEALEAKLEAEQANQAKSTFLSNMSHELRTPMHAILSYGNLGLESDNPEKHKKYFKRIVESSDRLMLLINDLLDLSKLEAGQVTLELAIHDLRLIALEAVEELDILTKGRTVSIDVSNLNTSLLIECDALRMGQVIRNLLSNAIKFSPENGRICLRSKFITAANQLVDAQSNASAIAISVSDEGQGIPESELLSIFEKFIQSSKTSSKAGGTGLGLSICREIIQYHSGSIRAFNNDTTGATFTFTLPLTQIHQRRYS